MTLLPFFLLIYVYMFVPWITVPALLLTGFLLDVYLVLPLGLCGATFSLLLLVLELYSKRYSATNPLFLFGYLAFFSVGWSIIFVGIPRVNDIVFFLAAFLVIALRLRKQREMQKHFV